MKKIYPHLSDTFLSCGLSKKQNNKNASFIKTSKKSIKNLFLALIFLLPSLGQAIHTITPFNLNFCGSVYPTAYQTVVLFSIQEGVGTDFTPSQASRTLILTLPAGFEFNTAAGTVTRIGNALTINSTVITTTSITVTLSTSANTAQINTLNFNNFQIRATAAGSGILARTGGTFLVNGSTGIPTSTESFGNLFAGTTMVYNSSSVVQYTTATINRNCTSTSNPILEIQINVTGNPNCGGTISQFVFNTAGDAGYSQNPTTNITKAHIYYSGQTPGFNYTGYFGTANAPNGAFTINGLQTLNLGSGTYYFYLVYDIPLTANLGDGLDASMTSFIFNAGTINNMTTPNPSGIRIISSGSCPLAPDMPNPPADMQTITAGSLVIPMDNAHQNLFNGYPFNIKSYGLVHALLMNDIPVKWVIRSGKTLDAVDFTANVTREYPSFLAAANESFAGGEFIIDSTWVNRPFYIGGQTATQVITAFSQWRVAVYKLTTNVSVDVRYTLNQRPKIAIFNNGGNNLLQSEILDSAKITNYVAINTGLFTGLAECYTFCSEAHWGGTVADTNITRSVRDFVNSGGNFLAECLGIDTYENNQGSYHFQTTNGITITNNVITNDYYNPDLAYLQINGTVIANPGGSEVNWVLNGGNFVPGFYRSISSSTNPDNIFTGGAHLTSPDSTGSNVFYLGGHDFSNNWGTLTTINAQRLYLNAATIPAHRPTAFLLDPGANRTICQGSSTTLGGSPTGPTGSTYNWSPATGLSSTTSANPVATPAVTTTYTVVANNNGCPGGPSFVTVTVEPIPTAPTASSNSPICEGQTLNLTASFLAGASYNWTGPNSFTSTLQNPSISNATIAATGTYSVTVTLNGCTSSAGTIAVTVTTTPPAPTAGSNSTVCEGSTLNLTASVVAGATYNWTGPNGFNSTLQNPSIVGVTLAAAGVYSVTATVAGCTSLAGTTTVAVNPTPTSPTATSNSPVCEGQTINLFSNTIVGATYSWTGPGGFSSALEDPTRPGATVAMSGVYSVTATVGGCTSVAGTVNVTVNPTPAAPTATSNSPLCEGQTINLFANTVAGATYSWTGPGGFSSALEDPTRPGSTVAMSGVYSVTVTVAGCTSAAGTTNVTVNPTPAAPTAGNNSPICAGQTLNLTSNTVAGATYSWTGPGGYTSALEDPTRPNATVAMSGVYSATVTVAGCTSAAGTVNVTINPTPAAPTATSNSPVCEGSTINLFSNTVAGATYSWTGPGGFSSALEDPTIPSSTIAMSGVYSVTVTVAGCTSAAGTTNVTVNPIPVAPTATSNSPVCAGQTINLFANTIAGATYSWTGPGGFSSALEDPTRPVSTVAMSGVYSVTVTVAGCTSAAGTVNVTVNPIPAAPTAGSNSPVCEGQTINLTANTVAGATYSWTGPGGFTSSLEDPTRPNATTAMSGVYSVTVTVAGCASAAGTTNVTVNPLPAAPTAGSNSPLCEGMTLNLTASNIAGASYSWTGPLGFSSALQNPSIPNVLIANSGTYSVTATVLGCTGPAGTVVVTVNSTPITPTASNNGPVCVGDSILLSSTFVAGATYSWTGPNGFTSTLQNPFIASAVLANGGAYTVTINNGCNSAPASTTVTVNPNPAAPTAGSNSPVCQGSTINLTANTIAGATYSWTGPNGFTSSLEDPTVPGATSVNAGVYSVNVTVNGCTGPNGNVTVVVQVTPAANAGSDQTVCANNGVVTLAGTSTTGSGTWTTSGNGTFGNANSLNTTYTPGSNDISTGTVTLTLTTTNNGPCASANDQMTITITPAPTVNAGPNQTVCANNAIVSLTGAFTISIGAVWTTSGNGTFAPSNLDMNATYTPGSNDISAGTVNIQLSSTGNGTCIPVTDQMTITITPSPVVNAGPDDSTCVNNPNATLTGTSSTGTATWSTSGTGSFSPNATTLNCTYIPSASDLSGGSVIITLTSTTNGNCIAVTDQMTLVFTAPPTVDAGSDQTVCGNNAAVVLSGTSSTTSGIWSSSGTGAFSPSANNLNATYQPSTTDISNGMVTLTLTSNNNGGCIAVTDQMTITITPAPTSNAGPDQSVCANNADVTLSGSFTISTGAQWSTSGTGTFSPDDISMNTTYIPSATDTAAGTVTIVLTTTGNGLCLAVTDTMIITITNAPVVNAGPDEYSCLSSPNTSLNGSSSTGSGTWTTLGSGTFTPSANVNNPTYNPGVADTTAGSVIVIFTSANNGGCNSVADSLTIFFTPVPTVNAGPDQTVCANNSSVTLNGASSSGSGAWSTSGSGTFTPSATTLNATYAPSAADTTAGSVTLTLKATNACIGTTDNLVVTITDAPYVNAGADVSACSNNPNIVLTGNVSAGASTGLWTTSGDGTFNPSDADMNATYIPGNLDTTNGSATIVLTSTGNGNCNAVTDTLIITYTDPPVADAGADLNGCANNAIGLSGAIINGNGTGIWTTTNGSGSFSSATNLNGSYTPVNGDTLNSPIIIILTSTNNGGCPASSDTLLINVVPGPQVNAGADQIICSNNSIVNVTGTMINAGGVIWSTTGNGTFTPDNISLSVTYTPDISDISSGSVSLIITSTGNGSCTAVNDTVLITFTPSPLVNAGSAIFICQGDITAQLNGSVTGATNTGIWTSSGSGTFTPSDADTSAVYNLSAADTAAGNVTVYLTSTNNGNCLSEMDSVVIIITTVPVVNAGNDTTICGNAVANLNGTVTGGSGTGAWSTNGDGTFTPDSSALNATYQPGPNDIAAGSVILVLTPTNSCQVITDSITITLTPSPQADAGNDIAICAGQIVNLNGSVTLATGGQWITSGDGTFVPTDTTLNGVYIPGTNDVTSGSVDLTLITTGNGLCSADSSTITINIDSKPVAQFVSTTACMNSSVQFTDSSFVQNGTISSWLWTINSDTSTSQNTSYIFTSVGIFTAELIVATSGGCSDTVQTQITVNPNPVVTYIYETFCPDSANFTANADLAIAIWNWNFGDSTASTLQNPTHTFPVSGSYGVSVNAITDSGCVGSFSDTVTINPCDDNTIFDPVAPTAFTPNGDGANDVFLVRGGPFLEFELRVFNEWGNQIHLSTDQNEGWDGKYKNRKQPLGAYVWTYRIVTLDNRELNDKGEVTILK